MRVEITLVRVEITVVHVEITLCVQKLHSCLWPSHSYVWPSHSCVWPSHSCVWQSHCACEQYIMHVNITLCVWTSHYACEHHTMRVYITLCVWTLHYACQHHTKRVNITLSVWITHFCMKISHSGLYFENWVCFFCFFLPLCPKNRYFKVFRLQFHILSFKNKINHRCNKISYSFCTFSSSRMDSSKTFENFEENHKKEDHKFQF
jgi:hypothetical protein